MITKDLQVGIEKSIKKLKDELGDSKIIFIHEDGQAITSVGFGKELVEYASIIASWFSAAKMLYECMGKKDVIEMGQWGEQSCIYTFPVHENYLLAVICEKNNHFPGWIWMKTKAYVEDIKLLLTQNTPIKAPTKEKKLFENISDKEIDDLFGGI